jgi:hypothetical protein
VASTPPASPSRQRLYRANCPQCGGPVEFASLASACAVCSFCRSTLALDGETLRKIGQSAEVFEDHSPLQLGASGHFQQVAFTLVGRIQYRYGEGTWNEWRALFDSSPSDGLQPPRDGWLSEDNGRYVFAFDMPLQGPPPDPSMLAVGERLTVNGDSWQVASIQTVTVGAAQGELREPPPTSDPFTVVDARSPRDEVSTLDYSRSQPKWFVGRSVRLVDLQLRGLREDVDGRGAASSRTLSARALSCPNCGAAVEMKLNTTQSIVCPQCHAVVDVSKGIGADLVAYYVQPSGGEPLLSLGTVGKMVLGTSQPLPWQVVGYVERCEVAQDPEDEPTSWREYLLYNHSEGFAFLVDAQDGWSWAAPLTGVPLEQGTQVQHSSVTFREMYRYQGKITYVIGEFYWRLQRDELTHNIDYQGTGTHTTRRLNREQTQGASGQEVVWSAGTILQADEVLQAFGLPSAQLGSFQRDTSPTALGSNGWIGKLVFFGLLLFFIYLIFQSEQPADCTTLATQFGVASQEYQSCMQQSSYNSSGAYGSYGSYGYPGRSSGGSYGGYTTGGGHK